MADEGTTPTGIVEYIKLVLDPASVEKVSSDAAALASSATHKLVTALAASGTTLQAFHDRLVTLRKDFETAAAANRQTLGDERTLGEVKAKAKKLGEQYNAELKTELSKVPQKFQEAIRFAMQATIGEMGGQRPREIADKFATVISERVTPMLTKAGVLGGKALMEGEAAGIKAETPKLIATFTEEQKKVGEAYLAAVAKYEQERKAARKSGNTFARDEAKVEMQELRHELTQMIPKGTAWDHKDVLLAMGLGDVGKVKTAAVQAQSEILKVLDEAEAGAAPAKKAKARARGKAQGEEEAKGIMAALPIIQQALQELRGGEAPGAVQAGQDVGKEVAKGVTESLPVVEKAVEQVAKAEAAAVKASEPVVKAAAEQRGKTVAQAEQAAYAARMLELAKTTAGRMANAPTSKVAAWERSAGLVEAKRQVGEMQLTKPQQDLLIAAYKRELNELAGETRKFAATIGKEAGKELAAGLAQGLTPEKPVAAAKKLVKEVETVVQQTGGKVNLDALEKKIVGQLTEAQKDLEHRLQQLSIRAATPASPGRPALEPGAAEAQAVLLVKQFNETINQHLARYGSRLSGERSQAIANQFKADGPTLAKVYLEGDTVGKQYIRGLGAGVKQAEPSLIDEAHHTGKAMDQALVSGLNHAEKARAEALRAGQSITDALQEGLKINKLRDNTLSQLDAVRQAFAERVARLKQRYETGALSKELTLKGETLAGESLLGRVVSSNFTADARALEKTGKTDPVDYTKEQSPYTERERARMQAFQIAQEYNHALASVISDFGAQLPKAVREQLYKSLKVDPKTLADVTTAGEVVGKKYTQAVVGGVKSGEPLLEAAKKKGIETTATEIPAAEKAADIVGKSYIQRLTAWLRKKITPAVIESTVGPTTPPPGMLAMPFGSSPGKGPSGYSPAFKTAVVASLPSLPPDASGFSKTFQEQVVQALRAGRAIAQSLSDGIIGGITSSKGKVISTLADGLDAVDVATRDGRKAGKELIDNLVQAGQSRLGKVRAFMSEWTSLIKVPKTGTIDPVLDEFIWRRAMKGARDTTEGIIAYNKAIKQAELESRLAGSEFTALGRILVKLGVDDIKTTSKEFQNLKKEIDSIGKAGGGAIPPVKGFTSSLGGLFGGLRNVAAQFGLYVGFYQVIQFFKSAVTASNEAEVSWTRLSVALADVGTRFSTVQTPILKAVDSSKKLGFSQKDTVEILGTLVQLTGDYEKSMKGLPVVLDVIRSRHLNVEMSAKLVARAIEGDTSALSRQGIVLDQNRDALQQLSEMMGREAAEQAKTFGGQVNVLRAQFFDLKSAIGDALKETIANGRGMDQLVESMESAAKWVRQNHELFATLASVLKYVTIGIIEVGKAFRDVFYTYPVRIIGTLVTTIQSIVPAIQLTFGYMMEAVLDVAKVAANVWDMVFHTHLRASLNQADKDIQAFKDRAKGRLNEIRDAWKEGWETTGGTAPEGPQKPKAPDFELGTGGPRMQREQQRFMKEVKELNEIMAKGAPDKALKAQEDLNKLLEDQRKKLEEANASSDERLKSLGAIRDMESNIAHIQGLLHANDMKQVGQLSMIMRKGTLEEAAKANETLTQEIEKQKTRREDILKLQKSEIALKGERLEAEKMVLAVNADIARMLGIQAAYQKRLANDAAYRAEEAKLNHEITTASQIALLATGKNQEDALRRLDGLHAQLLEKLKQQVPYSDHYFDTLRHIEDIEKVRPELANKEQAALDKRLSTLKEILEHAKTDEDRLMVTKDLDELQAQILQKQKGQVRNSDEWLRSERNLAAIAQVRVTALDLQNKTVDEQIKKLGELVEWDDSRAAATQQLNRLHDDVQKKLDEEHTKQLKLIERQRDGKKLTEDGLDLNEEINRSLERTARLRGQLNAIETAHNTAMGKEDERIERLEKELQDPKTSEAAFRGLKAEHTHLLNMLEKENVTAAQQVQIRERIARVVKDLADDEEEVIKKIREQIKLADDLYKGAKARTSESESTKTEDIKTPFGTVKQKITEVKFKTTVTQSQGVDRVKSEQILQAALKQTNEELEKGNLSETKRIELLKLREDIEKRLRALAEPSLNPYERLKQVYTTEFPAAVEGAASQAANAMEAFFEKQGVSIKTLKQSLIDLPKGLAKAMLAEIKQIATHEAAMDIAWALRETALGIGSLAVLNTTGAALHFASAGKHLASAIAWGVVGGAAGAASGGGGSGASAPSLEQNVGSNADNAQRPVTIFIKGGVLSTDDVDQMDALAKAMNAVSGRDVVVTRG